MGLMAKAKGESAFTPVSEGLHPAICSAVVDLGMQPGSDIYPKPKRQVYLRFDCMDEQVSYEKDGKQLSGPARCGATYTLSLSDKAKLRTLLESWRGKKFTDTELEGFDVSVLLGVSCQVQILHTHKGGNTYANVQAIVPWPKGVERPTAPEDAIYFSVADADCPKERFDRLPKWLQEKIGQRLADDESGLKPASQPVAAEADFDDDIPF